jgi:hypothetical protein
VHRLFDPALPDRLQRLSESAVQAGLLLGGFAGPFGQGAPPAPEAGGIVILDGSDLPVEVAERGRRGGPVVRRGRDRRQGGAERLGDGKAVLGDAVRPLGDLLPPGVVRRDRFLPEVLEELPGPGLRPVPVCLADLGLDLGLQVRGLRQSDPDAVQETYPLLGVVERLLRGRATLLEELGLFLKDLGEPRRRQRPEPT